MANIQTPQGVKRGLFRHALPIGAAIQRPIMEYGENIVGRQMYVQFDHLRTSGHSGLHRRDRVFDEPVGRRIHELRRAGATVTWCG